MITDKRAIRLAEQAADAGRECPRFDDDDLDHIARSAYRARRTERREEETMTHRYADHEDAEFIILWGGDEDDAFLAAVERHLDAHNNSTFTVRRARCGEAPGWTYIVRPDRTLQVLGFSVPKPEWLSDAELEAINAAIEAASV